VVLVSAAVGAAALLAGCGSTPSAGLLTNADIPAALHLEQSHSSKAQGLARVFDQTYPGCTGYYAVFTLRGRDPTPVLEGSTIYPQAFSESAVCPSTDKARSLFTGISKKVATFGARTLTGVGDAAILTTSSSNSANSYDVFWQDGVYLASIQLAGPKSDPTISAAEATLLAHRQIARQ
jgi:hypothetical protein